MPWPPLIKELSTEWQFARCLCISVRELKSKMDKHNHTWLSLALIHYSLKLLPKVDITCTVPLLKQDLCRMSLTTEVSLLKEIRRINQDVNHKMIYLFLQLLVIASKYLHMYTAQQSSTLQLLRPPMWPFFFSLATNFLRCSLKYLYWQIWKLRGQLAQRYFPWKSTLHRVLLFKNWRVQVVKLYTHPSMSSVSAPE